MPKSRSRWLGKLFIPLSRREESIRRSQKHSSHIGVVVREPSVQKQLSRPIGTEVSASYLCDTVGHKAVRIVIAEPVRFESVVETENKVRT